MVKVYVVGGEMNIIFRVGYRRSWDDIYPVCIINFTVPAHVENNDSILYILLVEKRWKMNHKSLVLCPRPWEGGGHYFLSW